MIKKEIATVCILLLCQCSFSQSSIHGKYESHFGSQLKLLEDSTFRYVLRLDTYVSWTNGKWYIRNDTIYLIPVLESVRSRGQAKPTNTYEEWLEVPEVPNYVEYYGDGNGGQNHSPPSKKLYFKKGRLYNILPKSKLNRKRYRPFRALKKYPTYYYRYDFRE